MTSYLRFQAYSSGIIPTLWSDLTSYKCLGYMLCCQRTGSNTSSDPWLILPFTLWYAWHKYQVGLRAVVWMQMRIRRPRDLTIPMHRRLPLFRLPSFPEMVPRSPYVHLPLYSPLMLVWGFKLVGSKTCSNMALTFCLPLSVGLNGAGPLLVEDLGSYSVTTLVLSFEELHYPFVHHR